VLPVAEPIIEPEPIQPLALELTAQEQEQFDMWKKLREGTVAVNEPEMQQWKNKRIEELTAQVRDLTSRVNAFEHSDIIMPLHVKSACPNCDEVHAASYQLTINAGQVKEVKHVRQQLIKRGRGVRKRFIPDEPIEDTEVEEDGR
jgi:hypothetical protein